MNPDPIVIIPVHRPSPTDAERLAIAQCSHVFARRQMAFLAPHSLDLAPYLALAPKASACRVDDRWMNSLASYNAMVTSGAVFAALDGHSHFHSHVLIHEPDALVVFDRLDDWCARPIDYIGAPWFPVGETDPAKIHPYAVGNSGLSLFRLEAVRAALSSSARWYGARECVKDLVGGDFKRFLRGLGEAGAIQGAWKIYKANCDIFWSLVVPSRVPGFRVASIAEALAFSWEAEPRKCHDLSGGALPMGFHAWRRYDESFILSLLAAQTLDLAPELRAAIAARS